MLGEPLGFLLREYFCKVSIVLRYHFFKGFLWLSGLCLFSNLLRIHKASQTVNLILDRIEHFLCKETAVFHLVCHNAHHLYLQFFRGIILTVRIETHCAFLPIYVRIPMSKPG